MTTASGRIGRTVQKSLLWSYRQIQDSGCLEQAWAQRPFLALYSFYKRHLEDPFARFLQEYPSLLENGSVLDIGANIGYTAILFSERINSGFKVYAFEPEARNIRFLQSAVRRRELEHRITVVPMAVGAVSDSVDLWINPATHADHRILTGAFRSPATAGSSQKIQMVSIDDYVTSHPDVLPVRFIKIDVQGFEEPVCHGMERTLASNPETVIAVEYCPDIIAALGFDPEGLLRFFEERHYEMYWLKRHGLVSVNPRNLEKLLPATGYMDLVYSRHPLTATAA
jgi:FkbM family methyltransferase